VETLLSQLFTLACLGFIILLGFGVMFRRIDIVFNVVELILRQTVELIFHILREFFNLIVLIVRSLLDWLSSRTQK
jgi:hypothetical protein